MVLTDRSAQIGDKSAAPLWKPATGASLRAGAGIMRRRSCSDEAPQARRQATIAVDLARATGGVPAEARGGDRGGGLDPIETLAAVERQRPGPAFEQVAERERHLLVQRVLELRTQHARQ